MESLSEFLDRLIVSTDDPPELSCRPVEGDRCPNCGSQLAKRPKRKTPCPQCKSPIVVRKGNLLTGDESTLWDWFGRLIYHGASIHLLRQVHRDLAKKSDHAPAVRDVLWRVFVILQTGMRSHDSLSQIYRLMSEFLRGEGGDGKPYLVQAFREDLLVLKEETKACGWETAKVMVFGVSDEDQCPQCRALHERKFEIDEALASLPIPSLCTNSSYGFCRCTYMLWHPSMKI